MTPSRYKSLFNGLNGAAKNVYQAIPIEEQSEAAQVSSELRRTSHMIDMKTIGGCIAGMVSNGLIVERMPGRYCRVVVREKRLISQWRRNKSKSSIKPAPGESKMQTEAVPQTSAIEKLGKLSERANVIGTMLRTLASDIEKAAIEIDDQAAANEKENQRLQEPSSSNF